MVRVVELFEQERIYGAGRSVCVCLLVMWCYRWHGCKGGGVDVVWCGLVGDGKYPRSKKKTRLSNKNKV